MKLSVLVLVATLSAAAFAATSKSAPEVRQIDNSKGLAVVQLHGAKVQTGDSLIATSRDATQCSLPVRSVSAGKATVDVGSCGFQLKVGQPLETSMIQEPRRSRASTTPGVAPITAAEIRKVTPANQTMGITIYAFYDNADKFKGDLKTKDQLGRDFSGAATFNSESTFGVGGEYAQYNPRFFGFYGNGAYEFGRDIKSTDVGGQNLTGSKPTLSMFLVGGGGNFSINDNIYLKAGVNYSFPNLSGGELVKDISGKFGFEGGLGARFAGNFNAEAIYRKLNFTGSGDNGTSVENLNTTGFLLRAGYLF